MTAGEMWRRILFRARRKRLDRELEEEMRLHVEQRAERYRQDARDAEDAEYLARRRFGNHTSLKEKSREMWGWNWMEQTGQDLRYAWRMLLKSPGFAVVAVLTLALGIGANTAVFSIIEGALLRPLPYKDPGRLVVVWDKGAGETNLAKIFDSYADFKAWEKDSRSFQQMAAATWAVRPGILTGRGPARSIMAVPVSASFFSMLGVEAARGRTFTPEDLNGGCSVVLSDRYWRGRLGSEQNIVGNRLSLNKQACTVLGVMPPGFSFYPDAAQLWTLITPGFIVPQDQLQVGVFGRLKPGVSREQAQSELTAIHTALHRADGRERNIAPVVYELQEEFTWLAGRNLRTTLWVLMGAVGLVLLIACLNVANLLLGRSMAREREVAVRAALGCGWGRLMRQLLTEGLLLSMIGAAFGGLVAYGSIRYFKAVNPVELPVGAEIGISMPVLAFTLGLSIVSALIFGLLPAWKAARLGSNDILKVAGRGSAFTASRQRVARGLLMSEMALSVVLLVGAGLLMDSVLQMDSTALGFEPAGVMTASFTLPPERYSEKPRRVQFYDDLTRRLDALPGIQEVALASELPPAGGGYEALEVRGGPPVTAATEVHDVNQRQISPAYFNVLKTPLLRGRAFGPLDRPDSEPVAVVNEALVKHYFPNSDPIGQRIRIFNPRETKPWVTIVGVVANEKHAIVYQEMNLIEPAIVFRPLAQDPPSAIAVAVRTSGEHGSAGLEIQRAIAAMDSEIPAIETQMLQQQISKLFTYPRFRAIIFAVFAVFALLLAAIGLHGILQQFVLQRTQEIGVRMAIGAGSTDILRLVVAQGGRPAIAGLAIGLVAAGVLTRFISSLIYGVRPSDLLILAAVAGILVGTAALAIAIPARRAARVDPMVALRYE